jgi:hypothetical protein
VEELAVGELLSVCARAATGIINSNSALANNTKAITSALI